MAAGLKYDEDKIRTDLLPVNPIMDIAKVLTFGAKKYADRNWERGIAWNRVYGALQRHLMAWWGGQNCDPETGLSHLSHAGCCIMFLMEFEQTHRELDNRPKPIYEKEAAPDTNELKCTTSILTRQDFPTTPRDNSQYSPPELFGILRNKDQTEPFPTDRHDRGHK